jgi:hypothetical protein
MQEICPYLTKFESSIIYNPIFWNSLLILAVDPQLISSFSSRLEYFNNRVKRVKDLS